MLGIRLCHSRPPVGLGGRDQREALQTPDRSDVIEYFEDRKPQMLAAIEQLVAVESWSHDLAALEMCAVELEKLCIEITGLRPTWVRGEGDQRPHLRLDLGDRTDMLLIGHFDTVHPTGTLLSHPTRVDGDRLYGLGALDMKSGCILMLEIARFLTRDGARPNVTLFFNSDEEIGSPTSQDALRKTATGAGGAMIFESTFHESVVKTGLRGVRHLQVMVAGKGGHAAYPEHYINPVDALGEVIMAARALHDPSNGVVVSPTRLTGSEVENVVPDMAMVHLDVRGRSEEILEHVEKCIRRISVEDERIEVTVNRLIRIPTFEQRDDNRVFALARDAADALGLPTLQGVEGRGASDANQIADQTPHIIEGLGGWGDGLHNAEREHILISSLVPSAALGALTAETFVAAVDEGERELREAVG